jgi:galacturan 1,4-alpha-galacturonidase
VDDPYTGREKQRLRFVIWDMLGYFPGIGDLHICEFLPHFFKTPELRRFWDLEYDRVVERARTMEHDKQVVLDNVEGRQSLVLQPSGEILARFVAARHGSGGFVDVLNAPNTGQIPNLPLGAIVETKCLINDTGVHPVVAGPLPDILEAIVRPILLREQLYAKAAYEWNKDMAVAALSTDPLVNDFRSIREMVDDYFMLAQASLDLQKIEPKSWQSTGVPFDNAGYKSAKTNLRVGARRA